MASSSYYNAPGSGEPPAQYQGPAYPPAAGPPQNAIKADHQTPWSGDKMAYPGGQSDQQRSYGGQPMMQQYSGQPPMNPYQMQQGNPCAGPPGNYGPPNPNIYVMGGAPPGPMNNQHHQSSSGSSMGFCGTCCAVFAGCCAADMCADLLC